MALDDSIAAGQAGHLADHMAIAAQLNELPTSASQLAETIRDRMGSTLVAGDGIAITVDDSGNEITVEATGSFSGGIELISPSTTVSLAAAQANDALLATKLSTPGKKVVAAGLFYVSDYIRLNSNWLEGMGAEANGTIFKLWPGSNIDGGIVDEGWYDNDANTAVASRVSNLQYDGNGDVQTAGDGHGIMLSTYRSTIEDCRVKNTRGGGIGWSRITRGLASTWSRSGSTITVTTPSAHGFVTGADVVIKASSATTPVPNGTYTITVSSSTVFTFTGVASGSSSGTLTACQEFDNGLVEPKAMRCTVESSGWHNYFTIDPDGDNPTDNEHVTDGKLISCYSWGAGVQRDLATLTGQECSYVNLGEAAGWTVWDFHGYGRCQADGVVFNGGAFASRSGEIYVEHFGESTTVGRVYGAVKMTATSGDTAFIDGINARTDERFFVTDGVTTNGDATVTSATANFLTSDVGKGISGPGIPTGAVIASRNSSTSIEMSVNATASASGVSVTFRYGHHSSQWVGLFVHAGGGEAQWNIGRVSINSLAAGGPTASKVHVIHFSRSTVGDSNNGVVWGCNYQLGITAPITAVSEGAVAGMDCNGGNQWNRAASIPSFTFMPYGTVVTNSAVVSGGAAEWIRTTDAGWKVLSTAA